jgi:N-acetylglutamate synthase-like GNAT family acetyltransferase
MGRPHISYLIDNPEHIPQLSQWMFEEWRSILTDETLQTRTEKFKTHMNRDKLPIAWIAHANGQVLGTAALRVHDLPGREDLTPWLGGVFVGPDFRRQGVGTSLCAAVEDAARSLGTQTLYLFTLDKQAWYSRLGWTLFDPCVFHGRRGDIMSKQLQAA